jgi:kynurenine 3-monooxygenase
MSYPITIAGSGLVGALQSLLMAKKGYKVTVFERRPDMRKNVIPAGRSINLALSNRGWKALELAGISDEVKKIAIPMYKRTMHPTQGDLYYQPYGKENEAIYSVSRAALNKILLNAAEATGNVDFHFNHRITDVDFLNKKLHLIDDNDKREFSVDYKKLFGCDGAFSAVRYKLQITDRFQFQQSYLEHGYKEFNIEPAGNGGFRMGENSLHIWPRKEFMMIALPNPGGSFTCTLFFPFDGPVSFNAIKTENEIRQFFEKYFPDLIPLIPDYIEQFKRNPTSSLATMRCFPWNYHEDILLLGDAAHAIVPFYGQGMNAGFEDCRLFIEMLDSKGWDGLFEAFSKFRKPDGDGISHLALRNFIEMRDLTADPKFLLRKKIENRFAEKYPQIWTPLYSMVTFSEIPYSKAWNEGLRQDKVMDEVMSIPDIESKWDTEEVMKKMLEANQKYN